MFKGIPVYIDDRQIPTFHPIHQRDSGAWYPSNEAASFLVHIGHIWDDILVLNRLRRERNDEAEKRLLFKYIIIELRSLFQPLERLQTIVMKAPERKKGELPTARSVTPEEKEQAKTLFKAYHAAKKRIELDVRNIRNNIGAHRDLRPWHEIISLWESLEPSRFLELLNTIPPIYNFVKELDLYDWVRTTEEGHMQILGARIYPDDLRQSEENGT